MLRALLDAAQESLQRRDLDLVRVGELLEQSKLINYSIVRITDNVLEIEERLEEEGVFDTLLIIRSYLITHSWWELKKDWWSVVDEVQQATAIPLAPQTVNHESKSEYYQTLTTTDRPRTYIQSTEAHVSTHITDGQKLWRSNDWLAVLWLLSFLPASVLSDLKKGVM